MNVTYVRLRNAGFLAGVNLSGEVQELLRQKAHQYGVTPQIIADQACANLTSCSNCEKWIEEYARYL